MIAKLKVAPNQESRSPQARPAGVVNSFARRALLAKLERLRGGTIVLNDGWGRKRLGEPDVDCPDSLSAEVTIHDPRFFRRALVGGSLAIGDAYLDGDWDCDDLTSLIRILLRDSATGDRADGRLTSWWRGLQRLPHRLKANTRRGSRKNIAAHYDLGNEFFRLMLDDTLAYSSGIFLTPNSALRDASIEKMDRICRKLHLNADDHVIEIGSGWGGWALHAATHYGCRVTTTTISAAQFEVVRNRVRAAGLDDRITVLQQDYRELRGRYDKLVSVEMIEAVGYRFYDDFFRACGRLLRPDGTLLLQCIVMPDRHYAAYLKSVDFIQRHVFPGGCLPSLGSIIASTARTTDLRFVHGEDFGPHYAETLRAWRSRFDERLDDVRKLGYDERFLRLWTYYLCYCEAAFDERYIGVVQLQFDAPRVLRDPIQVGRRAAATATSGCGGPA